MKYNFITAPSSNNDARNFIYEFSVLAPVAFAWNYCGFRPFLTSRSCESTGAPNLYFMVVNLVEVTGGWVTQLNAESNPKLEFFIPHIHISFLPYK
jgi:hypothetical protein